MREVIYRHYVKNVIIRNQQKMVKEKSEYGDYFEVTDTFTSRGRKYKGLIIESGHHITRAALTSLGERTERDLRNMIEQGFLKEIPSKNINVAKLISSYALPQMKNVKIIKDDELNKEKVFFKIDDYFLNAERLYIYNPYFYDNQNIFWKWDIEKNKWSIIDDTDMLILYCSYFKIFNSIGSNNIKRNIIDNLKIYGRLKKPKPAPIKWIQFKDKAFSLKSGKIYKVTPDYFFTNPIPWEFSEDSETPTMDKLFKEWVGEKYVQTLYEIIAYCCYSSYPIQCLFCLFGHGRNGKSQFLKIISKFISSDNICSSDLDLLAGKNRSRFESFKLFKKLVCMVGETNFGILESTGVLKQLTGGDLIGFEMKGKLPFSEYNYAKILIASNSLPSSSDTSEGFYRRWIIVDFPNEFKEGIDIMETIPKEEYNALATKVTKILPALLRVGQFSFQGNIQERKDKYIMASNPLPFFLNNFCNRDIYGYILATDLFNAYKAFLMKNKRRIVSRKEFYSGLEEEGLFARKCDKKVNDTFQSGYFIDGITLNVSDISDNSDRFPNWSYRGITSSRNESELSELSEIKSNYSVEQCLKYMEKHKHITKDIFLDAFGEYMFKHLKEKGDIIEHPKGIIRITE